LHSTDSDRLLIQLQGLVDAGNTVIVVEHDMRVAAQSDWVIDMGPGAGEEGGKLVVSGTPEDVVKRGKTGYTSRYLKACLP
jgi:excinuclease ABC subunit A